MAEHQSGVRPRTRQPSPPVALGRRASLFVSAAVVAHTLWTSDAPAMAYRLYADEWHVNRTATTGVFAIYPVVVALTLIGFGDTSGHIGRRAMVPVGLGAPLVGTLPFAMAPDVLWLFAARPLMGVGLTAGLSTAAAVELAAAGPAANITRALGNAPIRLSDDRSQSHCFDALFDSAVRDARSVGWS